MSAPRTPGVFIPVDDTGRVPFEFACARCLRRLEGPEISGHCPHCELPVRHSAEASVALTPSHWLGRLYTGVIMLIGLDVVRAIASVLLAVLNGLTVRLEDEAVAEAASRIAMLEDSVPVLAGHALLLAFAYFWLTAPPLGRLATYLGGPLRRAAALLLMLHVIAPLVVRLTSGAEQPSPSIALVVTSLGLVAHFALLTYLARLAARVPNRDLVLYARVLRWVLLIPPVLTQVAIGLGWLTSSGRSEHLVSTASALSAMSVAVAFAQFVFLVLLARQLFRIRARQRRWTAAQPATESSGSTGDSIS